jgi:pentatricopeptide repeat protein
VSTEQSTDHAVDHYVEALSRFRGDIRMMEQVLATMIERGAPRTEAHLRLMLDEYLGARSLRKARAIIDQLDDLGAVIEPEQQYAVAIATAAAGSPVEAMAIVDRLIGDQRDPAASQASVVLDLLIGAGRTPQAWSLFRRMRSRGQAPSRESSLALLIDCLDRRAAKDTVAVIQSMQSAGHRIPDGRSGPAVRMLIGLGQLERAMEVLETLEMAAAAGGSARPSTDTYGALLQALALKGRVDDVLAVAERLRASGVPLSSHHRNAILAARIAAGDLESSWSEAEEMWGEACLPTGSNLEALLDLTLAAGNVARAAGVLDLLLVIGVPVSSARSGAVLRAEMAAGGLTTVLPVAASLLDQGLVFDRAAARDLVERLVRARRLDDARTWLARFRTSGTLTQGRSYSSLLSAFAAAKRVADAVALMEEMVAAQVRPEVADLGRLVAGRLKAGELEEAERLLAAASAADVHPDEATLRELMWAFARRSDVAAVDRIIALLVAAGLQPDDRHEKARAWASGATPRRLEDAEAAPTDHADADPPAEPEPEPEPEPAPESALGLASAASVESD